ncbi:SEC-C motif-containing protein [Luteibacter sp. Sphag1AF]|uniref:YchJ family protein n=1 Tax=Luteibacter sp. Sphag1AF TaxID=2587031 RepID=UPI0017E81A82|nr:SEC-C motif-containing protein [Luteibacter sp. Sphag1AF]
MTASTCPCGSGKTFAACCAPLHEGIAAATAEALMRSRYSAYVLGNEPYLLATWHADTRPASLDLAIQSPKPTWLGLDVKRHTVTGTDSAVVEFVARLRHGGGRAERLHETSRFVRENGQWFYVDGDIA